MIYRITVAFNLKKGKEEYRYKAQGLYFQQKDGEPLNKQAIEESAKFKVWEALIQHYPTYSLTSTMKVTVKQMQINFFCDANIVIPAA